MTSTRRQSKTALGLLQRLLVCAMLCFLQACAKGAPVPGGSEAVNQPYFNSGNDLKERVNKLYPGMTEAEAFRTLGVKKEQMTLLDRIGIRKALFGGENAPLPGTPEEQMEIYTVIQESTGYKLDYKDVRKKHGLSSPIRMQTDEKGVSYSVTMVFHGGNLLEKPVLSGGLVNETDSTTIFDFLNPGTAIGLIK
ncbi:MAG TPA: hypothetical protein VEF76_08965 [Patescibacteria group bacterium]|nr:hypothetical protein [Patescibacteria group bacterium]